MRTTTGIPSISGAESVFIWFSPSATVEVGVLYATQIKQKTSFKITSQNLQHQPLFTWLGRRHHIYISTRNPTVYRHVPKPHPRFAIFCTRPASGVRHSTPSLKTSIDRLQITAIVPRTHMPRVTKTAAAAAGCNTKHTHEILKNVVYLFHEL